MMFIKWFFLAIIQVFLMVVHAVFSPVICLFINKDGYLPQWLGVFQTADNPAIGDDMFHRKEMAWAAKLPAWLFRYICGIAWAIRNPAYGFADMSGYVLNRAHGFTSEGTPGIDVGRNESTGEAIATFGSVYRTIINGDGKRYFEFRAAGKWNDGLAWLVELGWKVPSLALKDGSRHHLCVYIRPFISLKKEVV